MGVTRIVRRNREKNQEAERYYPRGDVRRMQYVKTDFCRRLVLIGVKGWLDLRPRDKWGHLPGPCAERAKVEREHEEFRRRMMAR